MKALFDYGLASTIDFDRLPARIAIIMDGEAAPLTSDHTVAEAPLNLR